jgi:hypothetical protein
MLSAIFATSDSEYILFALVIERPAQLSDQDRQFHRIHLFTRLFG